jgi:putative hydrolase of the HAD superfamily
MGKSLPKAILLDLDDTILAFSGSADPCWRRVCKRFACRADGLAPDELLSAINDSRTWFWKDARRHHRGRLDLGAARREIVAEAFARLGIEMPDLANAIADSYTAEREEAVKPFAGAVEALRYLKGQGMRLALITNGSPETQRRKIERFGLASFFDCVVIEGEFGVGKPDERVYQHALKQLDVEPEDSWMIGDNLEWDVEAPQRLGIVGVWLDHAGSGLPESSSIHPDRILGSLSELIG